MEKKELVDLLRGKYKKYMDNDDLEGLLFDLKGDLRSEMASFLMYDAQVPVLEMISEVPSGLFQNNTRAETVYFPNNIEKLGTNLFFGSGVKKVSFQSESKIDKLLPDTFRGGNIETIYLPDSLKKIPSECFNGCDSLQKVFIPKSVREFSINAFKGVPDSVTLFTPHREKRNEKIDVAESDKDWLLAHLKEAE